MKKREKWARAFRGSPTGIFSMIRSDRSGPRCSREDRGLTCVLVFLPGQGGMVSLSPIPDPFYLGPSRPLSSFRHPEFTESLIDVAKIPLF